MSPARSDEGGVPRGRRPTALPPRRASIEENWSGANEAKTDKLRRNQLQRRARASGFQLRHSVYGYALIDAARKRVDDRSDMSLDEVEARLPRT